MSLQHSRYARDATNPNYLTEVGITLNDNTYDFTPTTILNIYNTCRYELFESVLNRSVLEGCCLTILLNDCFSPNVAI
jgi:hypothetical protein